MPTYKLIYFDCRARGEIIRLLFQVAGVSFEDYRIGLVGLDAGPEWDELKPKTPFGQLPILEIDGEVFAQSHAIERYLAREFGLAGESKLDQLKVDMWIEASDEIIRRLSDNIEDMDPKHKEEDKKKIMSVIIPTVLSNLDKTLADNKSGFIVGDKLTVADLAFLSTRDWLRSAWGDEGLATLTSFKHVTKHIQQISEIREVAHWLKTRPDTQY